MQAWYLGLGAKDVLQQSCKNLHEKIEVSTDYPIHAVVSTYGLQFSIVDCS